MRTTLILDDQVVKKAAELTGLKEKTSLVRMGLEALIARESGKRLARLGGSEPKARPVKRRKVGCGHRSSLIEGPRSNIRISCKRQVQCRYELFLTSALPRCILFNTKK